MEDPPYKDGLPHVPHPIEKVKKPYSFFPNSCLLLRVINGANIFLPFRAFLWIPILKK